MLKRILTLLGVAGETNSIQKELLIVQNVIDLDSLEPERRTDLLNKAHELWENEFFHMLLDDTKTEQIRLTMEHAETEKQLWAGRANTKTVDIIKEEAQTYNSLWEADRPPEEFDKHSIT